MVTTAIEELVAYPAHLGTTGMIGNPMLQAQRMVVKTGSWKPSPDIGSLKDEYQPPFATP
ncbi:hypothetical protein GGD56_003553 [Rhizobium mongolense]|uniref:Uncharacterized protein n=2 Tax=Rhizobium mongolense TaxID=57676 RepID=A0ABR6IP89_9HYPH|nr:hypothetical protein [Rhizobium mongolense]TVZ73144.1 hypothetical protein BCL32_1351 [Rhizobium mongolense USDA 1844]